MDINKVIERLIVLTKEGTVIWKYADENEELCKTLNFQKASSGYQRILVTSIDFVKKPIYFDSDNSFYINIDDNYIVIFVLEDDDSENSLLRDRMIIKFVPRTFKDIETYTINDCAELSRLHTIIKSKFPSVKDIINKLFEF